MQSGKHRQIDVWQSWWMYLLHALVEDIVGLTVAGFPRFTVAVGAADDSSLMASARSMLSTILCGNGSRIVPHHWRIMAPLSQILIHIMGGIRYRDVSTSLITVIVTVVRPSSYCAIPLSQSPRTY